MKKKLSKVLAVVLSLVLAVGLAAVDGASVAQAAKKTKKLTLVKAGDLNVTSGETRTITIKGTKAKKAKWSVKGDGASYVSLNKTKGKKVKMTVADNATGTVKVVAKLTKKNKVTVTYTLSCEATAITLADAEGYTNEAIALETTVTPSNATAVDVTYAVYTDEAATTAAEKATVADGALTATEAGTYYVVATAGTLTSNIAKVVVTDKLATIASVKQTKANEIEVTFDSDATSVTTDNLLIANPDDVRVYVKEIKLDDSKKVATVSTLTSMVDGKEYTVTYGESSAKFTASTGEIASIDVEPLEAPINTDIKVYAIAKDAAGVELAKVQYTDSNDNYEFIIDVTDGYADASAGILRMEKVGTVAKVKVTYHSNVLNAGTGKEDTFVVEKEIVAVAEGDITTYEGIKFLKKEMLNATTGKLKSYDDVKEDGAAVDCIRVDGADAGNGVFWIHALVKDSYGNERVNGSLTDAGYTLSIADDTVALIDDDKITAVKEGKTQILVSKEDKVVFAIPVEVQAASYFARAEFDNTSSVSLTAGNVGTPTEYHAATFVADTDRLKIKAYDQYGESYSSLVEVAVPEGIKTNKDFFILEQGVDNGDPIINITAKEISTTDLAAGESKLNTYKVEVTDKKDTSKTTTLNAYVKVTQPKAEASSMRLAVVKGKGSVDMDTTVYRWDGHYENKITTIRLGVYDSKGTLMHYEYLPSKAAITLEKGSTKMNPVHLGETGDGINVADSTTSVTKAGIIYSTAPVEIGTVNGVIDAEAIGSEEGYSAVNMVDELYFAFRVVVKVDGTSTNSAQVAITAAGNDVDAIAIVEKAEAGRYTLKASNIKFDNGNVVYVNDATKVSRQDLKVTDNQEKPVVEQEYKTSEKATPDAIAYDTLRISSADSYGTYIARDKDNQTPYAVKVVSSKLSGTSLAITKVKVYVPYDINWWDPSWGSSPVTYVPFEVNINKTVKMN